MSWSPACTGSTSACAIELWNSSYAHLCWIWNPTLSSAALCTAAGLTLNTCSVTHSLQIPLCGCMCEDKLEIHIRCCNPSCYQIWTETLIFVWSCIFNCIPIDCWCYVMPALHGMCFSHSESSCSSSKWWIFSIYFLINKRKLSWRIVLFLAAFSKTTHGNWLHIQL